MTPPPGRYEPRDASARGHLPLPEALFVLGHDEAGRTRYHPRLLDVVLGGALLAEAAIGGAVTVVDGGTVKVADLGGPPPDARGLHLAVLDTLAGEPRSHTAGEWIGQFAPDATARILESLERTGLCRRVTARRLGLFRTDRIQFVDPSMLGRTEAWFTHALTWAQDLAPTDAVLAALGRELGPAPPAYEDLPAEERAARRRAVDEAMDESVRRVVAATRAAIAASAFGAYR
jgi:hypothetical protein